MGYSIFEGTITDMTWVEIEELANESTIVLFPMGVIEEHGPHLCLGTDIYLSYTGCKQLKSKLEALGKKVLVVPPYYWGINNVTGAFPGSFTVRKETMKNIIYDTLSCLKRWSFKNVYCFYGHGDIDHINAILEAIIDIRKDTELDVKMVVEGFSLQRFGLTGNEDYILPVTPPMPDEINATPERLDIHAGAMETSYMYYHFPECVNAEIAKGLPSTDLTFDELQIWSKGWDETRKLVPLGYAGSPANFESVNDNKSFDDFISDFTAKCIIESIVSEVSAS
ncbi:creatininase family protein [Paludicola sp. MB14-C6]|uniref:creatininase family protein n=1 Tax=Paludihabitans sp. MB14-C6 TaxID=3070656 RepID=UPI0027DAE1AB|nr:creatininase family protein [Paludicola sp. MB14-C6]WMJ23575.1 creatininase family protein [Paludicola sp. MB14-C6]